MQTGQMRQRDNIVDGGGVRESGYAALECGQRRRDLLGQRRHDGELVERIDDGGRVPPSNVGRMPSAAAFASVLFSLATETS